MILWVPTWAKWAKCSCLVQPMFDNSSFILAQLGINIQLVTPAEAASKVVDQVEARIKANWGQHGLKNGWMEI